MAGRAMSRPVISDPGVRVGGPENVAEPTVAARAYELWQERGCPNGSDQEDWFRAEQELKGPRTQPTKAA
jgi:hypothetical protein